MTNLPQGVGALMLVASNYQQTAQLVEIAGYGEQIDTDAALKPFGDAVELIVNSHDFQEVDVKWVSKSAKKRSWKNDHSLVEFSYNQIRFVARVDLLKARGLQKKVEEKMNTGNLFGQGRCVSADGEKIWSPSQQDLIPYVDEGDWGGVRWAKPGATKEIYVAEGYENELLALGWEQVELLAGIPLREIMKRPYDGISDEGLFYWLTESEGNPHGRLTSQLANFEARYAPLMTDEAIRKQFGYELHREIPIAPQGSWWVRVKLVSIDGEEAQWAFNLKKEFKGGQLTFFAQGWGRQVSYRPIPVGQAMIALDEDYRWLDLFDTDWGNLQFRDDLNSATVQYMGGEDGLEVISEVTIRRTHITHIIFTGEALRLRKIIRRLKSYIKTLKS